MIHHTVPHLVSSKGRNMDLHVISTSCLLMRYGFEESFPVCIVTLLERLGISVVSTNLLDKDKGTVYVKNGDIVFYCSMYSTLNSRRFVLAQCLAYVLVEGIPVEGKCILIDGANKGLVMPALELLLPESVLRRIHSRLLIPYVETLSDMFVVSNRIMAQRLKQLKLHVTYKPSSQM